MTEKHSYERAKREMRTRVGTTIGMAVIAGNMSNRRIRSQADIYEMNNQINAVNIMSQTFDIRTKFTFNRKQESDADKTGLRLIRRIQSFCKPQPMEEDKKTAIDQTRVCLISPRPTIHQRPL